MTRILIVDDEPDITLSFKMILEGNGFKVDTYNDPVKQREILNQMHTILLFWISGCPKWTDFSYMRN